MTRRTNMEHVEVLREMRDTGDVSDWRAMESALDAAIAALSAPQSPAEVQPVAWMDPDSEDVIHDMRKTSWSSDYGVGGEKKARTYTIPLYAHPPPSAPVGVKDIVTSFSGTDAGIRLAWMLRDDVNVGDFQAQLAEMVQHTLAQQPASVDDLNAWRAAFVAERAARYREGGMAIEQARIHAETDAARIDAQQGGA